MRNLSIVLLFGLVVCFLQGCDPGAGCSFYLIPVKSYKPVECNTDFKNDFETAEQIIEPFAIREGFCGNETPKYSRKDYQKDYKNGIQTISIMLLKNEDMIEIAVWEMPSFKLTKASQNVWKELVRQFQSEFGNKRIRIVEDCKISK
jgi:hypothetical protein